MTVLDLFTDDRAAAIEALHNATALYTAHPIVDGLLARLDWPHAGRTLFDPCAGDGSFLDAALRRLIAAGATVDDIVARISGWEIHPGAVASAHERLAATLTEAGFGDATRIARQLVLEHDFLTDAPAATYDAIATNPPYLRFAHVPPMLREQYETTTPDFACSDLLHAFLHRCAQLLTPNGRIAAVTSDRWLFIQTAAQLRERLGSMLSLTHLTRLDASTSFYRPKHRRAGTPPRIHPVEVLLERTGNGITLTSAPIYPDAQPDTDPNAPTLGEVATLKLAPWLGTPGIFVVSAAVAATLPADTLVPAIDTDNFRADDTIAPAMQYAIRTTAHTPPPTVLAHLERTLPQMCERGKRRTNPTWLPPETWTQHFPLDCEALLVPRIAKRLRVLRLPIGHLPINHNVTVIVAPGRIDEIEAALRSESTQRWIAARAHRLENGYLSMTTSLLRQLPLPTLNKEAA